MSPINPISQNLTSRSDCWEERRDRYDKDDAAGRRCNVDGYDLFYGSDFEEDSDDEW